MTALMRQTKANLARWLSKRHLPTDGGKADLAARILAARAGAPAPAAPAGHKNGK